MKDFISDNNPAWRTALAGHLPDWLEKSAAVTDNELSMLSSAAFADPVHRLHPMHTKAAAFSSLAYLLTLGASLDSPEVSTIKQAASMHGIDDQEIAHLEEFIATLNADAVKSASAAAPRAALSRQNGDVTEHFMSLATVGDVMESAEELAAHYRDGMLPVSWACEAAGNIKSAAAAFGLPLPELHPVIGELTDPPCFDYATAMELVGHRKLANCDPGTIANYEHIVQAVAGNSISPEEGADLIEILDKAHEVKYAYAQRRPWDILHAGPSQDETVKMAQSNVVVGGVLIPSHVFASIPEDAVKMRFAGAQADAIAGLIKDASVSPAIATMKCAALDEAFQRLILGLALDESAGLTAPDGKAASV